MRLATRQDCAIQPAGRYLHITLELFSPPSAGPTNHRALLAQKVQAALQKDGFSPYPGNL
jgi:hypothetical protein